eukprot:TRINITY_DN186_c0_g1_i1.p1 TRINITY_DN186_c0_g1~~TRINITY_DN186_c0_g1_i1.p1  ORF type:complete len:958 (+),score=333.20 TRINITY_DN186_c0_g1_i1:115-2874(+)
MKTFVFFALLALAAQGVDWSTETADSLSKLPPKDFIELTAALLATITPEAIQGFQEEQFRKTPAAAWGGLTPFQFFNLTTSTCSYLNKPFFQNVPAASFQNFTSNCVTVVPAEAFQGFDSTRLAQVTPLAVSFFSGSQLFELPDESAKLLSGNQASKFNADSCHGLRASFLNNANSTTSVSRVTPACVANVNATQFTGFSADTVRGFNADVASVLTQLQVVQLGDNCAGVTPQFLAKLVEIQNATVNCVSKLPANAFSQVSAAQVSTLLVPVVNTIQKAHFEQFNPAAAAGFSVGQVAAFNKDSCGGITADFASQLLVGSVHGLTPDCAKNANQNFFSKFSDLQAAQLTLEVVHELSENQILYFNPAAAAGFSADAFNKLEYDTGCKGLDANFVSFITPASIRALPAPCVKNARDAAFSLLKGDQVANMTDDSFSGFRQQQVEVFSLEAAARVKPTQAAKWGVDTGCAGLGGLVASKLPTDVFPVITKDCLAHTNSSFFSDLPDASVAALPNATYAGVQDRHFAAMPARVASDLNEFQTSQFSNDACKGVTATVLGALAPASGLKGLTQGCLSNVPGYSFTTFTPSQLNSLNCSALNSDQVAHLPVDTFGAISIVCVAELSPSSFSSVTPQQLSKLPLATISLLTASQLSQFSPLSVRGLNVEQIQAINTNATAGFTADQLGNLTVQWKDSFVDAIPLHRWTANPKTAAEYVAKVGVEFDGLKDFSTFTNETTWIQLANVKNGSFVFDSNFVARTYPVTFLGLVPMYVSHIREESFPTFTAEQTPYLLPAVVAQFTASQVKGFSPAAFGALYPPSFSSLSSDALKALSDDQIKAIPSSVLKDCTFADHLEKSGRNGVLTGDAKTNYDVCIATNNGGDGKSGLTGGQIAGIVIGTLAGVAVIGGAIFYFVRRKKANYQAI